MAAVASFFLPRVFLSNCFSFFFLLCLLCTVTQSDMAEKAGGKRERRERRERRGGGGSYEGWTEGWFVEGAGSGVGVPVRQSADKVLTKCGA